MLVNLSNHPSGIWSEAQKQAAAFYGEIVDIPFPMVDPGWTKEQVSHLSSFYELEVWKLLKDKDQENNAVHLMGELTFCFAILKRLQNRGIVCIASTTERIVSEDGNSKTSEFNFYQFREYCF